MDPRIQLKHWWLLPWLWNYSVVEKRVEELAVAVDIMLSLLCKFDQSNDKICPW